jgi:hypothetical protein
MMGILNALYLKRVVRDRGDKIPSEISVMRDFGQMIGLDLLYFMLKIYTIFQGCNLIG